MLTYLYIMENLLISLIVASYNYRLAALVTLNLHLSLSLHSLLSLSALEPMIYIKRSTGLKSQCTAITE